MRQLWALSREIQAERRVGGLAWEMLANRPAQQAGRMLLADERQSSGSSGCGSQPSPCQCPAEHRPTGEPSRNHTRESTLTSDKGASQTLQSLECIGPYRTEMLQRMKL